jgi:hypothetical protein
MGIVEINVFRAWLPRIQTSALIRNTAAHEFRFLHALVEAAAAWHISTL